MLYESKEQKLRRLRNLPKIKNKNCIYSKLQTKRLHKIVELIALSFFLQILCQAQDHRGHFIQYCHDNPHSITQSDFREQLNTAPLKPGWSGRRRGAFVRGTSWKGLWVEGKNTQTSLLILSYSMALHSQPKVNASGWSLGAFKFLFSQIYHENID